LSPPSYKFLSLPLTVDPRPLPPFVRLNIAHGPSRQLTSQLPSRVFLNLVVPSFSLLLPVRLRDRRHSMSWALRPLPSACSPFISSFPFSPSHISPSLLLCSRSCACASVFLMHLSLSPWVPLLFGFCALFEVRLLEGLDRSVIFLALASSFERGVLPLFSPHG